MLVMLIIPIISADTALTPTEKTEIEAKIVEIDAKIVKCDMKPQEIVQEEVAVYDKYIKAVNQSFAAWLGVLKQRMIEKPEIKAAEVKQNLTAEKATLVKLIAEPNLIEDVKPK